MNTRPLLQAERGGTRHDNRERICEWRILYSRIPIESTLPQQRPVEPMCRPMKAENDDE